MENSLPSRAQIASARRYLQQSLGHSSMNWIGRRLIRLTYTVHGLGAFALITLGVVLTKFHVASRVIHPLVRAEIHRAGIGLLPFIGFLAVVLGFLIIGQSVSLLSRVGATDYAGIIMVSVVVRELGPLITAVVVLARIGTTIVIELGTARALGEVEAFEALGIDPIHYLVVPRVTGLAISIFCLTIYFILAALLSGYLFAFLQDVPLQPGDYFSQLAAALTWQDFVLLTLKSSFFGIAIAIITSFHGLARPLRLEEVSSATTRAVVQSIVVCTLLDALFILVYLIM